MPKPIADMKRAISSAEKALSRGAAFASLARAIELLEVHVFNRLRPLSEQGLLPPDAQAVWAQAAPLLGRLEAESAEIVLALRRDIAFGRCSPEALRATLVGHAGPAGRPGRYDALDLLVAGVLDGGPPDQELAEREPDMVAYQPTPVRSVLALIERASIVPGDVFYDLGSGLGWVVILVALLSGARAKGIEFEQVYRDYAVRCARRLNVVGVEFVRADVRSAPLEDGSVFFLYTPFRGVLLRQTLDRLQNEAAMRPIRVCTLGPCTAEVRGAAWLAPEGGETIAEHEVAVFRSRGLGSADRI